MGNTTYLVVKPTQNVLLVIKSTRLNENVLIVRLYSQRQLLLRNLTVSMWNG